MKSATLKSPPAFFEGHRASARAVEEPVVGGEGFLPASLLNNVTFAELTREAPADGIESAGTPLSRLPWPLSRLVG